MNKLKNEQQLVEFLNNEIDEATFFGYDKESLLTLRQYLENLKHIKCEYDKNISMLIRSIRSKNPWVNDVVLLSSELIISGEEGSNIIVSLDNKTKKYVYNGVIIENKIDLLKVPFRKKIVNNSQKELHKIAHIRDKFYSKLYGKTSISENFIIKNHYGFSTVSLNNQIIFMIDRESLRTEDYDNNITSVDQREKMLRKIMIKNN